MRTSDVADWELELVNLMSFIISYGTPCVLWPMQMLQRYEESMVDLETLLKIDPSNSAAKKELQLVVKSKEDEVCLACL